MINATDLKETLTFTQETRLKIIEALAPDGKLTDDKKTYRLLNEVLDSMDNAVLTKEKLQIEEGSNQVKNMALKVINEVFQRMPRQHETPITETHTAERSVSLILEEQDIAPGETDIGIIEMDYDSFVCTSK
jgi:hypothetical protein